MPPTLTHSNRALTVFAVAILLTGMARLALTLAGVEQGITRWASMTGVILIAIGYFAPKATTARERVKVAYGVILPYMTVELTGIGYTWWSGRDTVFHAEPYTLGTPVHVHFWGHLAGGLTWEPAIVAGLLWAVNRLIVPRPGLPRSLW